MKQASTASPYFIIQNPSLPAQCAKLSDFSSNVAIVLPKERYLISTYHSIIVWNTIDTKIDTSSSPIHDSLRYSLSFSNTSRFGQAEFFHLDQSVKSKVFKFSPNWIKSRNNDAFRRIVLPPISTPYCFHASIISSPLHNFPFISSLSYYQNAVFHSMLCFLYGIQYNFLASSAVVTHRECLDGRSLRIRPLR